MTWTKIFDGNNLDGWVHVDAGNITLQDNMLVTSGGMGLLYYEKQKFEDCVLKVIYKNPGGANSGVFIRIPEKPTEAWMPVNRGFEVQIYDAGDDYHYTGALYSLTPVLAKPAIPDKWNELLITLQGDYTKVEINGTLVTEYTEGDEVPPKKIHYEPERGPRPKKGYIGLQNHGDDDIVYFKEVSFKRI